MKVNEFLIPLFDKETANTRRILECVPLENPDWKPHEKSMSLVKLAGHVAELPEFLSTIINTEELELATAGFKPFLPKTKAELLAGFEEKAKAARTALAGCSDAHLAKNWSLKFNGQQVFGGKRDDVLATTIGHLIHHRGQLTVYLRLNNVKFPGVYGPSADEMSQFS